MDATFAPLPNVDPARLAAWRVRRNAPGLIRLAVQLGGLALCVVALERGAGPAAAWIGVASLLLASLFAPMHEAIHGTAFASRALNRATLALCGTVVLHAPFGYRGFHFAHHRHTHDPALDPEIAIAPRALGGFGPAWWHVVRLTGVPLLGLKLLAILGAALAPTAAVWEATMPFVPAAQRSAVAWEARAMLVYVGGLAWLMTHGDAWIGAVVLGAHAVLAFVLSAEHNGLPADGGILGRTRSIESVAAWRWLFWNMPYHAEHHAWPAIPFHHLHDVHAAVRDVLPERHAGYVAVHRAAFGGRG